MPKKVHGRPPAKARQRTRRPATTTVSDASLGLTAENGIVAEARSIPVTPTTSASLAAKQTPRTGATVPVKRPAAAARKAPGIVINYHYLRRDIRTLGVLAPSMVVLLVIAFFVFR